MSNHQFARATLNAAGTILENSHGQIFFELNGKSTEFVTSLKNVLQMMASISNGRVAEGISHPVTQSTGTFVLELDHSANNQLRDKAATIRNGILFSNNCYCYASTKPTQAWKLYAEPEPDAAIATLMGQCFRAVPVVEEGKLKGFANGRSLRDEIITAISMHAHVSGMSEDRAHVPTALYAHDAVKGKAVEVFLRGAAEYSGGQYKTEMAKVDGREERYHYVISHKLVGTLLQRKSDPLYLLGGGDRDVIEADVARYSGYISKSAPIPVRAGAGNVLDELGIVCVDSSTLGGFNFGPR